MMSVMVGDGGWKRWARRVESATGVVVMVGLAGEVVLLPLVALVAFLFDVPALGIGASAASPLAVVTIVHMTRPRRWTMPLAASLAAMHAALVIWTVAAVAWWLRHAGALGFDAAEVAFLLALATAAGFVAARVAWSLRPAPGRFGQAARACALGLAGLTAITALAAPVSAAVSRSSLTCGWFHPSPDRWARGANLASRFGSTDRERMAAALQRCGTLTGASQEDVRRLLGPPASRYGGVWSYVIAEESGFALDPRQVGVVFRDDRVARVVGAEPAD